MKKKVYCYELDLDLLPNFLDKIKVICNDYANYMIYHQKEHYTYIGLNPKEYIYTQDKVLNIVNKTQFLTKKDDFLRHIFEWLNKNELEINQVLPPFFGGAMGFINDCLDDYYKGKTNLCDIPQICFMIFDDVITIDYQKQKIIFTYVGDFNNEGFYQLKYRQFIKQIDSINVEEVERSHTNIKFNEDEILTKFAKIKQKFSEDRFYLIKNAEKVCLETNLKPIELFYKFIHSNKYSTCSYFKTNDFSLIVNSDYNDISLINNTLSLTVNKKHNINKNIISDLIKDQVYKLSNALKLTLTEDEDKFKYEGRLNNNTLEVLRAFMMINVNYGLPLERIHSYIRRTEGEYRLNGLACLLSYNNNLISSQIIEPIILDLDEHYINIENYHSHNTTGSEYINEVINQVNQYLDILDS